MWSFWSRNPSKDFPYDISKEQPFLSDGSFWMFHKGKKKSTGEDVSIFQFDCEWGKEGYLENAKSALKRLKTLRHPSILTYIDSMAHDKIIFIVTEPVMPLREYLKSIDSFTKEQRSNAISYGLYQVAVGIGFLNNDCNCVHNNINTNSIQVNCYGIWKIGGFEYMTTYSEADSIRKINKHSSSLGVYDPPEISDSSRAKQAKKWSVDSYAFGCLIWEIFNSELSCKNNLKSISKIPSSLVGCYKQFLDPDPNSRLPAKSLVEKCRDKGSYLKNPFIDSMLFLNEIQIKNDNEKNRFFGLLNDHLDSFPPDICKSVIVNQLSAALEFNSSGSAVLGPLLKIGRLLIEEEYQKKIIPCVVKLFSRPDRATRGKLLNEIESYIDHFQPNVINEQIFPHVAQGFLDTNTIIREQTVKSMLHFAPKLNNHNLNEIVLKNFARLQTKDEESGIRTNTAVCLGKIAKYLSPQIRQTVLIPFFLRSMRDPFAPAREAGILALAATQNFYTLRDTATKVMPALCHLTLDPDKSVRDRAFKTLKGFISKLDKVSEDPSLVEQMEADLNVSGSNVNSTLAATWASWAIGSLTSKFYRSKQSNSQNNPNQEQSGRITTPQTNNHVDIDQTSSSRSSNKDSESEDLWASLDDNQAKKEPVDGWDDNWLPETEGEFSPPENNDEKEISSKTSELTDDSDILFKEYERMVIKSQPIQSSIKEDDEVFEFKEPVRVRKVPDTIKERRSKPNKGPMKLGARKIS